VDEIIGPQSSDATLTVGVGYNCLKARSLPTTLWQQRCVSGNSRIYNILDGKYALI
jgi:hypothetical protein